jgi:DNA-binding NarL/FixJ family response regulator
MMPVMNGWDMLKKLREDKWGNEAKVIMLTVAEDTEAIARAVEGGSLAYLIKTDQSTDDIVEKVKTMIKSD